MLSLRNVSFAYGDGLALDDVSLDVGEGEVVGLVGPNGAGKSTMLSIISGVLRPSSGSITLDGVDLLSMKIKHRAKRVAALPQEPISPPGFTVLDLVLMGRNPHVGLFRWESRRDVEAAARAMEMTRVRGLAQRPLDALSGGERRRAFTAAALAQEAPVLLLDEPTASLDLAHQIGIMDLVSELRQERGRAVLAAIHDLTLAAQYCDRLVLLSEGRVCADGRAEEVLSPETISQTYGAEVSILRHPAGGTPVVLPVRPPR